MVEAGTLSGLSPKRQAEIDVVSDFLGMAESLLADTKNHPAVAVMLTGAALEEFLRNWTEELGIDVASKGSIDSYAKALRGAEHLDKQDVKDITGWGGRRNAAAHGDFDAVDDPQIARLMLEGVNLFMRKHGAE